MAVQKINYEDKIGLQNDPNVPDKNKVTDENMNEIKSKVNNNADELTTAQQNIKDLEQGQGTASTDITSLKNRVTTLETDNTTNKQDINTLKTDNETNKSNIATLQTDNETNKTNISTLQEDVGEIESNIQQIQQEQTAQNKKIEELDDNQIHVTTEKANNINIKDVSGQNAKIKLFGVSKQEGTPSPENPITIENTTGNIEITDFNKNFFDENDTNNFKYGVGDDFTTKNDDGTFKTIANFSLGRNKGTKIVGLKANTDYIVSLDIKNITSTATSKAAEVEIIENAEKISIVMQKDFKNLGINTLEFNSGSYQDLSLHISGYTYSEVSKSVSVTFADVLIAEKSNDNSYVEHEQQVIIFPLAENQKMYGGSYLADDGIHHKRKQVEFNGTENWELYIWQTAPHVKTTIFSLTNVLPQKNDIVKYCNYFNIVENTITNLNKDEAYCLNSSAGTIYFSIPNEIATTTEQFKNWLAQQKQAGTPVIVEYELAEEEIETYTEEQQTAYNQLQNAKTYKTVTNVFTDNAEVEMEYVAHTKTYIDNEINSVKEQLNTINELLSTTTTSAMLLDNMQTDLESEVV